MQHVLKVLPVGAHFLLMHVLNSGLPNPVLAICQNACYSNLKPVARAARTLFPTCASHLMVVHLVDKAAMPASPLGAKHALLHVELASINKLYVCIQNICMYAFTSKHTCISSLHRKCIRNYYTTPDGRGPILQSKEVGW